MQYEITILISITSFASFLFPYLYWFNALIIVRFMFYVNRVNRAINIKHVGVYESINF